MDVDLTTLKKPGKQSPSNQRWTREQEELLASWSERASGYRWLHSRSEKLYRCRNYTFTIPVIILSTLTGTANFAMDSFVPEENKQLAMACVGGVNIFAGVLSTLQNFLRYAELMESHRVAEVSWSKLSRDIAVELTLEPTMRKPAFDFLNVCRAEYDRLIEQSPSIDDDIIKRYKNEFNKLSPDFSHPHVCNGLHKCRIFESSAEEKKAQTLASAGDKFMSLKKKHWEPQFDNQIVRKLKVTQNNENNNLTNNDSNIINNNNNISDSKKELESLVGLNRVSKFKQNLDESAIDKKDKHPLEQINDIIKQQSDSELDDLKSDNNNVGIKEDTNDIEKGINENDEIKETEIKIDEIKSDEIKIDEIKIQEDNKDKTEEDLQSEFINSIK
jgi:hypothetical protein